MLKNILLAAFSTWISIEIIGYVSVFFLPQIYDIREAYFARLNEADFQEFRTGTFDQTLGWRPKNNSTYKIDNCLAQEVVYNYDSLGARKYSDYNQEEVDIVIVGDSYSLGSEAQDDETIAAQVSQRLGRSVANHGVGGYGPTQAVLNAKRVIGLYPKAKIVVLGFMYENINRMVNSYRAVYFPDTNGKYSLKPYMKDGRIESLNLGPDYDYEAFLARARQAFDDDFWSRPIHTFPYSYPFVDALTSQSFWLRLGGSLRHVGLPQFHLSYTYSEDFEINIIGLLNEFSDWADQNDVIPVVIFVPSNRFDYQSAGEFIARHRDSFRENLHPYNFENHDIDWMKYNLKEDGTCHPSLYGYTKISEFFSKAILEAEARAAGKM